MIVETLAWVKSNLKIKVKHWNLLIFQVLYATINEVHNDPQAIDETLFKKERSKGVDELGLNLGWIAISPIVRCEKCLLGIFIIVWTISNLSSAAMLQQIETNFWQLRCDGCNCFNIFFYKVRSKSTTYSCFTNNMNRMICFRFAEGD